MYGVFDCSIRVYQSALQTQHNLSTVGLVGPADMLNLATPLNNRLKPIILKNDLLSLLVL